MSQTAIYSVEVRHPGLNKFRVIRGSSRYEVGQRADALKGQWNEEWNRRVQVEARRSEREDQLRYRFDKKGDATERSQAATHALNSLASILVNGARSATPFVWAALKDPRTFSESEPTQPVRDSTPPGPLLGDEKYNARIGLLEYFSAKRRATAIAVARRLAESDKEQWAATVREIDARNALRKSAYELAVQEWKLRRAEFEAARDDQHASIDAREAAVAEGNEDAISELIDHAIDAIEFPDCVNANHELDFNVEAKSCVIDFNLPNPNDLPTIKEVRYVQSRDEFTEKYLSDIERGRLYDSVLYQIALRVMMAAFKAESNGYLERVTFNGWVDFVDRANGMDDRSCIMTVGCNRSDFDRVDFERVDPRECFRSLKGVAAAKLVGLAPVAPLQRPRIVDSRFVESHEVAANIDAGMNIAAMDWQEFEHLVRQLFAHLYSSPGSEVHVTQASRDGGVDAIIFDPDPIKGGKIVIQAKRYTNVVGVSAVRDLFGTVHNEGATKGILVTTSCYGSDALKFAADKPLALLDGGNLLSLLEGMGVKARIDLREAKLMLAESN